MTGTGKLNWNYVLIGIFSVMLVIAVASNFYHYYYTQDYYYTIETGCDPTSEKCFFRDCETEECPPNEYSYYKIFSVKASDFPQCRTNECKVKCATQQIDCVEISCEETEECAENPLLEVDEIDSFDDSAEYTEISE